MKSEGTTPTSTEVQRTVAQTDQELIDGVVNALTDAEAAARSFVFRTTELAAAILDLHQSEAWKRVLTDGKPYASATAFYRDLANAERFPILHRVLRQELVDELMTADGELMVGVRELAALVHVDPSQITRDAKKKQAEIDAKKAEADAAAKAAADAAAIEAAAAEAAAAAAEAGKTEAEIQAAADAVQQFAAQKAAADAKKAEADAAAKAAAAEAKKTANAIKKAITGLGNAIKTVDNLRPDMKPEDASAVLAAVAEAVRMWEAFDTLNAPKPQPQPQPKPKPRGNRRASA